MFGYNLFFLFRAWFYSVWLYLLLFCDFRYLPPECFELSRTPLISSKVSDNIPHFFLLVLFSLLIEIEAIYETWLADVWLPCVRLVGPFTVVSNGSLFVFKSSFDRGIPLKTGGCLVSWCSTLPNAFW